MHAKRRRSSGITRNLRNTGRRQAPSRHDSISLRPAADSRPQRAEKPLREPDPGQRRLDSSRFSAVLHNRSRITSSRAQGSPTGRASSDNLRADTIAGPQRLQSGRAQPDQQTPRGASKTPSQRFKAPTSRPSRTNSRPAPVPGTKWQILTRGGAAIPCEFRELQNWKHGAMAVVGVSLDGRPWRDWDAFRAKVRAGADGDAAWAASTRL